MRCPDCGSPNAESSIFCGNCGSKLPPSQKGFPKISLWLILLYIVVSFGFYLPAWFLVRLKTINMMESKTRIGSGWLLLSIILNVFSVAGSLMYVYLIVINGGVTMEAIIYYAAGNIASLLMAVILIIEAYKVVRIFDDHYNTHLGQGITFSNIWVLVGNILYLQYKINKLPK